MKRIFGLQSLFALVIALALCLRVPYISAGLPYFYDEDEAHHFDHVVDMLKNHELNPNYFNKPSLHFYLRMPVILYATYLEQGRETLTSIKDVRTHDRFGIGTYALSASHPGLVKWARALSVFFSLALIIVTYLLGKELFGSAFIGVSAALVCAVSPPLLEYSATIGVDVLMALMCSLTVYFSVRLHKRFSTGLLLTACICAGLSVSSKYNAAPIVALPFAVCLLQRRYTARLLAIAIIVPLLSFLAGTPYLLVSLGQFYKDVHYEMWHYAVAGHEGHSTERGLPQILFYSTWFGEEALGWIVATASLIGAALYAKQRKLDAVPLLLFPLLFSLLMILQKTNFTRNMLVLIPHAAICAAYAAEILLPARAWLRSIVLIGALAQPAYISINSFPDISSTSESRLALEQWIKEPHQPFTDIAVDGRLQCSYSLLSHPGVTAIDLKDEIAPNEIWNDGYDYLVTPLLKDPAEYLVQNRRFDGSSELQRVVRSPAIDVYGFDQEKVRRFAASKLRADTNKHIGFNPEEGRLTCSRREDHCWLQKRLSFISIDPAALTDSRFATATISFSGMTPWEGQTISLILGSWQERRNFTPLSAGTWQKFSMSVPRSLLKEQGGVFVEVLQVHSPQEVGTSKDDRRLGVAIKDLQVS